MPCVLHKKSITVIYYMDDLLTFPQSSKEKSWFKVVLEEHFEVRQLQNTAQFTRIEIFWSDKMEVGLR